MCEVCSKVREECWAEIRDLLEFDKGPLALKVKEGFKDLQDAYPDKPEDELKSLLEAARANMIYDRCVMIARGCEHTEWHMMPLHMIAGTWAGDLLRSEAQMMVGPGLGALLSQVFGLGQVEEEDDEDDD